MSADAAERLRRAAALAAQYLRSSTAGASSRVLSDIVNDRFATSPATRSWLVRRAELEAVLATDPRFTKNGDGWTLAANGLVHDDDALAEAARIVPFRPGIELALHTWQREALESWRAAGRRGIIEAVTASGKTRVAEAALAEHLESEHGRGVIVVPTIDLANQWLRRLHQIFALPVALVGDQETGDFARHSVLVYIAASAVDDLPARIKRLPADLAVLLVADECHRYGSEGYRRILDGPFSATLGLSATPERANDDGMERYILPLLGPVVYVYDHERGISENVIVDFALCFVGVDFEPIEASRYESLSTDLSAARRALVAQFPALRDSPSFMPMVKQLAQRDEEGAARWYLSVAAERSRLTSGAHARHDVVVWLAEQGIFSRSRTLIFHERIADCEYLAEELRSLGVRVAAHHSEVARDERRTRLAAFGRGELDVVIAPRTLDEGIDVPDASLAIIVAGTRVRRQTIQRIGRVLRRADGKSAAKVVRIFVHGAADDPQRREAPDGIVELMRRPSTVTLRWPAQGNALLEFLRN